MQYTREDKMAQTSRWQSHTFSVCKHMASDYMCDKLEICVCFGVHFRIRTSNDAILYFVSIPGVRGQVPGICTVVCMYLLYRMYIVCMYVLQPFVLSRVSQEISFTCVKGCI